MTDSVPTERLPSAGVLRRLGAMFYDLLLVVAVLIVLTSLMLPLTGGEAVTVGPYSKWKHGFQLLELVVIIIYFGVPWTRSGQTLGMQAWRLRVEREDGARLGWADVLKRLAAATVSLVLAFAGYWWIWIDRDKLAWHDRWTRTRVVVLPKNRS
ncbi:RDD family protein [Peristeroidobacter agariperforans]|uniref:RDD family protein n=1 Tax=Peristeroidobacter agariperforans TaxID=268404 RepID=UPI00101C5BC3|nr:RDD family protein [Peristeroidobacter agariperforans]